MTFLAIAFLFVAAMVTWQRLHRAEERIDLLEGMLRGGVEPTLVVTTDLHPAPVPPVHAPEPTTEAEVPLVEALAAMDRMANDEPIEEIPPRRSFELPSLSFNFEDIFGRLLPIWAGGITLAVAGFFLVRYSIELGLMTPAVRVLLSFLFGVALLGGAEVAYRFEEKVRDPRVRQALAGAGLATLYASFLLAGRFYGLIGTAAAFAGLAGVTVGALVLAGRFGLPTAILGLVGGFAAPMLVGGEEANMPVLTLYLALVTGGLNLVAARQRWAWLGLAALGAGLGWGGLLLLGGIAPGSDSALFGLYVILVGIALPFLAPWKRPDRFFSLAAAAIASGQLALLVSSGGFTPLNWGLYLLLLGALSWLAWKDEALVPGTLFAQAAAILLLFLWPEPDPRGFAAVSAAIFAIGMAPPLLRLRQGNGNWWTVAPLTAVPLGLALAAMKVAGASLEEPDLWLGLGLAGLASAPVAGLFLVRAGDDVDAKLQQLSLGASSAILLFASLALATPIWLTPVMASLVAGLLVAAFRNGFGKGIEPLLPVAAVFALICLTIGVEGGEWERLTGWQRDTEQLQALLRWASVAAAGFATAWGLIDTRPRRWMQALGAATAYGALAQLLPHDALAASAAAAAIAATYWKRLPGARNAWLVIAALWAGVSMAGWLIATLPSVDFITWVRANDLPGPWDMTVTTLPLIIAGLFIGQRFAETRRGKSLLAMTGIAALMLVHVLFKQLFDLDTDADFAARAYLERSLWEVLLLGAAVAAYRLRDRLDALALPSRLLAAFALAHFVWYSLLGHNPFWDTQSVGPVPLANLLLVGFGAALGALWLLSKMLPEDRSRLHRAIDFSAMALLLLLALSLLRQALVGDAMASAPVTQTEELLRSLTAILVAIGFLIWGARTGQRSWRIGSLVLMTLAVFKVFLQDAADLEGLWRIASFIALGFSLIGVGWFYSRQLGGMTRQRA